MPVVLAVIAWEVAPVLHKYETPEFAVNTTDPPIQKLVGPPAVIVEATVLTVRLVAADVFVHPLAPVTTIV